MDYVIITCSYYIEIKSQLILLGIQETKILDFANIYYRLSVIENPIMELMKGEVFTAMSAKPSYDADGLNALRRIQEKNLFLSARNYVERTCGKRINALEEIEFQVFSQFGEDGIIQWLIHNVELERKIFVEFGIEDYKEANTRFLLMNDNWSGLIIDGSESNIERVRRWESFWKYDLKAVSRFITRDNINSIIMDAGIEGDIGLLSIDLDGNDYWILNEIRCVKPRILICEYNNIFGCDAKVTVPYDELFYRTEKHYSNLYWGCSIGILRDWAERNGFWYVGSNGAGNNAFFVRKDCMTVDKLPVNREKFVSSKYRESRDENGKMTYLNGEERLRCIREMKLIDMERNCERRIEDIFDL